MKTIAEASPKVIEPKKSKSLYFDGRVMIAPPQAEAKMFAILAILSEAGFRHEVGIGSITGRYPHANIDQVKTAITDLAAVLKASGHGIVAYSVSEVWVDSGSFDTLKLLDEPPHADKH